MSDPAVVNLPYRKRYYYSNNFEDFLSDDVSKIFGEIAKIKM